MDCSGRTKAGHRVASPNSESNNPRMIRSRHGPPTGSSARRKPSSTKPHGCLLIGRSGDEAEDNATETNRGSGTRGNARSGKRATPRRYRSARRKRWTMVAAHRDRDRNYTSRFASLWALHCAAEASLLQHYRAKMAAAHLCSRSDQLASILAYLAQERDAALRALRAKRHEERREPCNARRNARLPALPGPKSRWRPLTPDA